MLQIIANPAYNAFFKAQGFISPALRLGATVVDSQVFEQPLDMSDDPTVSNSIEYRKTYTATINLEEMDRICAAEGITVSQAIDLRVKRGSLPAVSWFIDDQLVRIKDDPVRQDFWVLKFQKPREGS